MNEQIVHHLPEPPLVTVKLTRSSQKDGRDGYEIAVSSGATDAQITAAVTQALTARTRLLAALQGEQDTKLSDELEASLGFGENTAAPAATITHGAKQQVARQTSDVEKAGMADKISPASGGRATPPAAAPPKPRDALVDEALAKLEK